MRTVRLSFVMVLMILLVFNLAGCGAGDGKAQARETKKEKTSAVKKTVIRPVNVKVRMVKPMLVRDVLILPGSLVVWQDVRVSAGIGGRIEWIGPKEGQKVTKGELLATIDLKAMRASLEKAQAAFNLTDDIYKRRLALYERKIITREVLDRALTENTMAAGNIRQLEVQLAEGQIRAPISGVVNKTFVDAGEFAGPGMPLLDIVDITRMKIEVNIPEMDIPYLKVGQKALVRVDAFPKRTLKGSINFVSYKADPATKTFQVIVAIKNPKRDLRAGMIARLLFLKKEIKDAVAVPLSALVDKSGERLVFVIEDDVAHARTVKIGVIERDKVQITKGLDIGEMLVVTGQTMLEEGVKVSIK